MCNFRSVSVCGTWELYEKVAVATEITQQYTTQITTQHRPPTPNQPQHDQVQIRSHKTHLLH